jgi:RNA polymerase sigma-70 factor (ECF subfamily)
MSESVKLVEERYEEYRKRLVRYATQRVGDSFHAEDIVSEAMIKAMYSPAAWRGNSQFYSWLCAIVNNQILMHFRSRQFKRADLMVELDEAKALPGVHFVSPLREAMAKEEFDIVLRLISEMSPPLREFMIVYFDCDGHFTETMRRMGLNNSTAKSRLHRVRKMLKAAGNERTETVRDLQEPATQDRRMHAEMR